MEPCLPVREQHRLPATGSQGEENAAGNRVKEGPSDDGDSQ